MVSLTSFLVQNLKSLLLRKEKTSEKSYLWLFIEIKPRQSKCSLIYHVIQMSPHFLTTFHNFEASPVFCFPSLPLRKTKLTRVSFNLKKIGYCFTKLSLSFPSYTKSHEMMNKSNACFHMSAWIVPIRNQFSKRLIRTIRRSYENKNYQRPLESVLLVL